MKQLLALILLVIFTIAFKGCGETKGINVALDGLGIPTSAANFKHDYRTPQGVMVRSTQELPASALNAIDEGIRMQIARTAQYRPEWTAHNQLSQYAVLVIEPTAYSQIDVPGAPLIQLSGGTTAGTVIGIGGTKSIVDRSYIVIPHQNGQQWRFVNFFREAVMNESEHDNECNNPNRQSPVAECEMFQGWQDVHPHQFP